MVSPTDNAPKLLSGGNPQITRGDGNGPVQAYIAAMPGWQRQVGLQLDRVIGDMLPDVRKAVKWNSPLYGGAGEGWSLGLHCITRYVKLAFFRGADLDPMPPVASKTQGTRYLHIHEGDVLDEGQLADWVRQASLLPGTKL